jgi:apolipoprotein N-acyltransferase
VVQDYQTRDKMGNVGVGRQRVALTGAGLGAGALAALSLPPWGWWPLALVGAAVLAAALRDRPWPRRLLAGFAAGVGLYGIGLWWMIEFSAPGYVATTLLQGLILAGAMAAVPPGRGRLLAFPAALVLADALHGHWPFGGVPLGGIALGQAAGPLAAAARLGGHLLLVALVAGAGAAVAGVAEWVRDRRVAGPAPARPIGAAAGLVVVVLMAVAGAVAPRGSTTGTVRVAAVQGGGTRGFRAVDVDRRLVFDAHVAATARVRPPVDVVLWPEDVVDVDGPVAGSPEEAVLAELARTLGTTLVVGVVEDTEPGRFRNAALAFGPDGALVARYDKVHRVPFGEYVPGRDLVDRVADLSAVPRDAIPGRGPGLLRTGAGRLGVLISYEVFFADRARDAVGAGAEVLLVPTNASSFRTSQVPGQELAAARLRAVETGRTVVQAAPTGYTAVVDAHGRVRARSGLGGAEVLARTVDRRQGRTLASRIGELPLVVLAALLLVTVWGKLSGFVVSSLPRRAGRG